MAQVLTSRDALRATLMEEMARNPAVVLLGEDIGVYQGTFRITADFLTRFGPKRVIDAPISELGFVGAAVGMAMVGLRPVVEVMTWNFSLLAADQILNNAAKLRYFSGGQVNVPLVIRGPNGDGVQLSAQHSQSLEALYAHFPGLWVVALARPAAEQLAQTGIEAEVINLRTLRPLDRETLIRSVRRTHRAVVVQEQWRPFGAAAEIAAGISEGALDP